VYFSTPRALKWTQLFFLERCSRHFWWLCRNMICLQTPEGGVMIGSRDHCRHDVIRASLNFDKVEKWLYIIARYIISSLRQRRCHISILSNNRVWPTHLLHICYTISRWRPKPEVVLSWLIIEISEWCLSRFRCCLTYRTHRHQQNDCSMSTDSPYFKMAVETGSSIT
jgi:hypothetical protein